MKQRAYVKNEGTSDRKHFIVIESENGGSSSGDVRFNVQRIALQIADQLNKAYKAEGRLYDPYDVD